MNAQTEDEIRADGGEAGNLLIEEFKRTGGFQKTIASGSFHLYVTLQRCVPM